MEARVAKLEAHVEHIRADVASINGRLAAMDTKFDALGEKVTKINLRLAYAAGALFSGTLLVGWLLSGKLDALMEVVRAAQ